MPQQRQSRSLRTCRQQPREYPFLYTIPNGSQIVANLGQQLDKDATFYLREIVPLADTAADYRYQLFDPAKMPIQDSPVNPWWQVLDPIIPFPPGGQILLTVEDTSGSAGTEVALLFRGVNEYSEYQDEPRNPGHCMEVPKTYYLQIEFTEDAQMLADQIQNLDLDAEFDLRQVLMSPILDPETQYQFSDRQRSFVQSGLMSGFPGVGIYDPAIRYPEGGNIVVNAQGNAGLVTLQLVGVNRYRV